MSPVCLFAGNATPTSGINCGSIVKIALGTIARTVKVRPRQPTGIISNVALEPRDYGLLFLVFPPTSFLKQLLGFEHNVTESVK